jgi:site-specific recombinase XerD
VEALRRHAGGRSAVLAPDDLVFATANGTELDAHNVRRSFRRVAEAPGLDPAEWTPRELRHSFVPLLSASGVRIEDISRLVGHSGSGVTAEKVYRHQLHAVLDAGAAVMDTIFPPASEDEGLTP